MSLGLINSSSPSAHPSMFLTTVKSCNNTGIRRNVNRLFMLYNGCAFVEFGFVRHIFGDVGFRLT